MKYEYTWNHVLLFARICGRIDDADSVTASWVQITEDHNRQTFPFTLWPLTYRTCEVTTSPAMCSPVHIPSTELLCSYDVKMFKCNEVVIICIQNCSSSLEEKCDHPCVADLEIEYSETGGVFGDRDHAKRHSVVCSEPLLPCHVSHCYDRIKSKVIDAFYEIQEGVENAIFVGHGSSAALASCLASDMSRQYEAEKEFLGLDKRRVGVDFVGFSDFVVASPAYWDDFSSCIDQYILVVFESTPRRSGVMKPNPRSSRVIIDGLAADSSALQRPLSRSESVFHKIGKRLAKHQKSRKNESGESTDSAHGAMDQPMSSYLSALQEKVNVPL